MKRGSRTRNTVVMGAAVTVGAAVLSLPFLPSLRRYMRMKRM
jgi:uncharacterized protein DUF6893